LSGLVALVSREPERERRGRAALDRLRHDAAFADAGVDLEGAWLGACGRPGSFAVATSCKRGVAHDAAAVRLAAAVCGDVLNLAAMARELGVGDENPAAVALAAYERWGAGLFSRFEGCFALVVHDSVDGVTLAGCDPVGVGVVRAVRLGDDVLFASEAKAFLADSRFTAKLDLENWQTMVALGRLFNGKTLFAGVQGLPQGSHFRLEGGRLAVEGHWDPREHFGAELRGRAYVEHMAETVRELGAELFRDGPVLLPLTGGLDSRLVAASAPEGATPAALTFGRSTDPDVVRGRQIARVLGWEHRVVSHEAAYVADHAASTVWLAEGHLDPSLNLTGCAMRHFTAWPHFLSGLGGDLGRYHFLWARRLLPSWPLLRAGPREFEVLMLRDLLQSGVPFAYLADVFGNGAKEFLEVRRRELEPELARTRGLSNMKRLHLYEVREEVCHWRHTMVSGVWIAVRAPFLTRRFVAAVFSGADAEVIDDLARLRVIRTLKPHVAAVPWTLTHMPLPASEPVVRLLRQAAKLRRRGDLGDGEPPIGSGWRPRWGQPLRSALADRIYEYGDDRERWLRDESRSYVEQMLLSDRCLERGLVRRPGVQRLLDEQMRGASHSRALGQLLLIELWNRLFVDGDGWEGHGVAL
jgi:asparagine synthetase B (glutamine-hydrolysing)